jgi:hypothetical protein
MHMSEWAGAIRRRHGLNAIANAIETCAIAQPLRDSDAAEMFLDRPGLPHDDPGIRILIFSGGMPR